MDRVLAAARQVNERLMAELAKARKVAQQPADLEAGRIAAHVKAEETATIKVVDAMDREALLLLQRQTLATATKTPSATPPDTKDMTST